MAASFIFKQLQNPNVRTLTSGNYCSAVRLNEASAPVAYSPDMLLKFSAFIRDQSGATAIEYAIIAAGIALAVIPTVKGIGPKLNTTFSSISTQLK